MNSKGWLVVLLVLMLIGGAPWLYFRAEGRAPVVDAPGEIVTGLRGGAWTLSFTDEGAGLRDIQVVLVHADGELPLADAMLPGNLLHGGEQSEHTLEVRISPDQVRTLPGAARLRIVASDWSLLGNRSEIDLPVEIDRKPPGVEVESGLTYVRHGGSGAVAYRLSEPTARDGVLVGDTFFRGYPKPGGASGERVALFAIPSDAEREPNIRVLAEDAAGNATEAGWAVVPRYKTPPEANVSLDRRFIERILPRFGKTVPEDDDALATAFDDVNRRLRAENEQQILAALKRSDDALSLGVRLAQMANSKVTSRFGERRRYMLKGQRISDAIHYGYDLAATARAPITASGGGRVVHAGPLGIYGNCVLIDHGMGLATLYGHLSRIEVSVGDRVEQGTRLGLSGDTGLAGGDHLHFAVLVGGVYVDPIEWWDPEWVKTHVRVAL